MSKIKKLSLQLDQELSKIARKFKAENVSVVMPTYVPQRGEILQELSWYGVETLISGGYQGAKCFRGIDQVGMPEDTLPYTASFPEYITKGIVDIIPEDRLKGRKVAVFSYVNNLGWSRHIKNRNLDTEIVATVEQNLRNYFEEKGNLLKILDTAGLSAYKIPTEHVSNETPVSELAAVYHRIKNEDGKVVVQDCCSENGNAGGKGTVFIDNVEDFVANVRGHKGNRKVARFIKGYESNLSFFAGNRMAAEDMLGAKKMNLTPEMNPFDPDTLDKLLKQAEAEGITSENIVTVVGRGTLKAVGDENLTSGESNGVGNDIGYVYEDSVRSQIKEVGRKLSTLMARAGKVGLAGADLIIDHSGKVWINEINDRQQGPTAQMSKDAEQNGIPSLLKVALISSYADFKDEKVQSLFRELQSSSAEINEAYTTSKGEFYLKVHSTHPQGQLEYVQKNLMPGYYDIVRQKDNSWKLEFSSYRKPADKVDYKTDPAAGRVTVKLVGGDWKAGDHVDNGSQLFRLTGITDPKNPPFIIKGGKTRLNPQWQKVVEACYNYLFGEGYMQKNPLLQKRRAANGNLVQWKPVAIDKTAFTAANGNDKIVSNYVLKKYRNTVNR